MIKQSIVSTRPRLPWLTTQMARAPFTHTDKREHYEDGFLYEKVVFLSSFLEKKWLKKSLENPTAETADFVEAVKDLRHFSDFRDFLSRCRYIQKMTEWLKIKLDLDIQNSNIIMTKEVG